MPNLLNEAAAKVFAYPARPLHRRHGPRGYADYQLYKPWLRDDFCFRCVYCQCRESWEPNGQYVFSVEHIEAQTTHPDALATMTICFTLVRCVMPVGAKCRCLLIPVWNLWPAHLQTLPNGMIDTQTKEGRQLCDLCHLNRPMLVQFRRYLLELIELFVSRQTPEEKRALQQILGFPEDLPNLRSRPSR